MDRTLDLIAVSPWLAPALESEDVSQRISSTEAKNHIGRSLIVRGRVVQVSIRDKSVYLNLDKPYPEAPFTAVIFARTMAQFGNLLTLAGKEVEISGKIIEFHGRPEIVISAKSQLKVLDGTGKAAAA